MLGMLAVGLFRTSMKLRHNILTDTGEGLIALIFESIFDQILDGNVTPLLWIFSSFRTLF